ncbi:MAG TPA: ArsR family transcriptional regulator [Gemmatimonadales bacterium]|nr:ArsR family transcriptional regulator [Gemmatimonadales bacterium]
MTNWLERLIGDTQARLLSLLRRPPQTITGLSAALGVTDNAVRTHIAALGRDGIVEQIGTQRDTGGKPARVYALTEEGEELFPKAYSLVLAGLVEQITRTDGPEHAMELLRGVGERLASGVQGSPDVAGRVTAAAAALRSLGGDIDVQRTAEGWRLQGYGCPLSAVTSDHAEVCELARTLVAEITGQPVSECCDRAGRPRCGFQIKGKPGRPASNEQNRRAPHREPAA